MKIKINEVVGVLKKGGIVVFPTDTVYGFLALAENKKALNKIYRIKNRPRTKPLPVFVKDLKMAKELAEISKEQEKLLKKYWPGKYTFLLKSKIKNNLIISNRAIALRIPNYKPLNDLLKKINKPLAQTSVNISGQPPMTKIKDILNKFRATSEVALIFDAGDLPKRKPSKIIDLIGEILTRLR
jgi:L-threonylcarbamoyladenylate synthase